MPRAPSSTGQKGRHRGQTCTPRTQAHPQVLNYCVLGDVFDGGRGLMGACRKTFAHKQEHTRTPFSSLCLQQKQQRTKDAYTLQHAWHVATVPVVQLSRSPLAKAARVTASSSSDFHIDSWTLHIHTSAALNAAAGTASGAVPPTAATATPPLGEPAGAALAGEVPATAAAPVAVSWSTARSSAWPGASSQRLMRVLNSRQGGVGTPLAANTFCICE